MNDDDPLTRFDKFIWRKVTMALVELKKVYFYDNKEFRYYWRWPHPIDILPNT